MRFVRHAAPFVCLVLLAGCGPRTVGDAPTTPALPEVSDLLRAAAGAAGRPPANLSDLDGYKEMFPQGYEAVQSGNIVVLWGAPMKGEGEAGKDETVVAYEKAVPTDGGFVLLSSGTIKKMTAAQFNAAPKGGAK